MARKLRLEFPGACYHVINRGNYRADLFRTEGAKAAFEAGGGLKKGSCCTFYLDGR